jgi:Domain of unknown function (DUF4278)
MQLTYRGSRYEVPASEVKMKNTEISARFRGQAYKVRCPMQLPLSERVIALSFRGHSYLTH